MAQPLSDRSTNTHLANNGADAISHEKIEDLKSAPANLNSLDYHRQVLQGKIEEGDKYVFSPFLVYTRRETNITVQEPSQLRLALGWHYEPLLEETQQPQGKALQEVCYLYLVLSSGTLDKQG